jgi:hypothetical protein
MWDESSKDGNHESFILTVSEQTAALVRLPRIEHKNATASQAHTKEQKGNKQSISKKNQEFRVEDKVYKPSKNLK